MIIRFGNSWLIINRKALELIFEPVATVIANCITEQINAVRLKKVDRKSDDKTAVDVSTQFASQHSSIEI